MIYTVKFKKKFLGITFTKKIKNVKFHNFPTDFNNGQFMLVVLVNEERHLYNLNNYDIVEMPAVAFINPQQQEKPTSKGQKELLNKI